MADATLTKILQDLLPPSGRLELTLTEARHALLLVTQLRRLLESVDRRARDQLALVARS
jgi:hypothetical protein